MYDIYMIYHCYSGFKACIKLGRIMNVREISNTNICQVIVIMNA